MIVLHLLDPESPDCGSCAMRLAGALVERAADERHTVIAFGGREQGRRARSCGVPVHGTIPLHAATSGLARVVRARSLGSSAVVHAWSFRAALLASSALPDRPKLATLTAGPPPCAAGASRPRAVRRVRDLNLQSMPMLACSAAVAQAVERAGIRPRLVAVVEPPVVPPAGTPSREHVRRRWRVPEGAFVVGVLADPAPWSSARAVVQAIARVAVAGRDVRLVLSPGLQHASAMRKWFGVLHAGRRVIIDDEAAAPWMLMPGIDAAFVPVTVASNRDRSVLEWTRGADAARQPTACAIPESWARTLGVPVIVERNEAPAHGFGRSASAGVNVNDIAHRLVELADAPARPCIEARADDASIDRWAQRYASLHERVCCRALWADAPGAADAGDGWAE